MHSSSDNDVKLFKLPNLYIFCRPSSMIQQATDVLCTFYSKLQHFLQTSACVQNVVLRKVRGDQVWALQTMVCYDYHYLGITCTCLLPKPRLEGLYT